MGQEKSIGHLGFAADPNCPGREVEYYRSLGAVFVSDIAASLSGGRRTNESFVGHWSEICSGAIRLPVSVPEVEYLAEVTL